MRAHSGRLAVAVVALGCGPRVDGAGVDQGADGLAVDAALPWDGAGAPSDLSVNPLPALPLRTQSRWILDRNGRRFKLASVNWYGAEEKDYVPAGLEIADLDAITIQIRSLGFNSVRLPWSNEMFELNPIVPDRAVAANPSFVGWHALQVLDAVIASLARQGLVVILDNHTSRANWCCSEDAEGLWYQTDYYPEDQWVDDWKAMAARYLAQPAVVGVDLRNEVRTALDPSCKTCSHCPCASCTCRTPTWGGSDPSVDWHRAATRAGNAVLSINPNLLIVVEGIDSGSNLMGAYGLPITLSVPGRLVYSSHDYAWFHAGLSSYQDLYTDLGDMWGYLLTQNRLFTAPVWVGEFGTCHTSPSCVAASSGTGFWFQSLRMYLGNADIDWAYWAINGTQATGDGRIFGAEETYGVLNTRWDAPASYDLADALRALQRATQGP